MSDWPTCSRCGRDARPDEMRPSGPRGWEGPPLVCPNCQFAEWHPHCTSWLDDERKRVAWRDENGEPVLAPEIAAMPYEERHAIPWQECDYIDLTVSWVDDDEGPKEWRCPECGGTAFEGVHRDYGQSGLKGAGFKADIDFVEMEDDDA